VIIQEKGQGKEGLRTLVYGLPDLLMVAEVPSGPKALTLVANRKPDITIVEMGPSGSDSLELIRTIVREHPHIHIMAIAGSEDGELVRDVIAAGVTGCLLSRDSTEEVGRALMALSRGESYYSPDVSTIVMDEISKPQQQ
jgi:DNA-binding NarL/FixJ family response regulator